MTKRGWDPTLVKSTSGLEACCKHVLFFTNAIHLEWILSFRDKYFQIIKLMCYKPFLFSLYVQHATKTNSKKRNQI